MGVYAGRRIDLVALDVEGCVTPTNRGTWNLAGIENIKNYCRTAQERELPPVILVTGRSAYAEAVVQAIGALGPYCKIPSVIENGALLWHHNEKRAEPTSASKGKLKQMKDARRFLDEDLATVYRKNFVFEIGKEICISLDPFETDIESLYEIVREELRRAGFMKDVEVTHSSSAVDITPKGVNKWSGFQQALKESGIEKENVLGVGDSVGDVSWLSHIGHKAAPANATKDLRKIGLDYISPFAEAEGVADILRHFILEPAGPETKA